MDLAELSLVIRSEDAAKTVRVFQELRTEGRSLEEQVKRVEAEFNTAGRESSRLSTELNRLEEVEDKLNAELDEGQRGVEGLTQRNKELAESNREIQDTGKGAGEELGEFDRQNSLLGRGLRSTIGLVRDLFAAFALYRIVEEAKQALFGFSEENARLRGLVTETIPALDAQTAALERLQAESARIGTSSETSAAQIQASYSQMISSGFELEESIAGSAAALELAEARGVELSETIGVASRLFRAFDTDAESMSSTLDLLQAASLRVPGGFEKISEGLVQLGPIARALDLDFGELVSTASVLAQLPGGSRGIGALRDLLFGLASPTEAAAEKIRLLEQRVGSLDPRANSLSTIIQRLAKDQNLLNDATEIFGRRAASGVLLLAQNADQLAQWADESEHALGINERLARHNDESLGESYKRLKALGETLVTTQTDVTDSLRGIADTAVNVVKNLFEVEDAMARDDRTATALADAIGYVSKAMLVVVPTVALVQLSSFLATALQTKTTMEALFGLLAAHPFTAVAVAVGALAFALYNLRPNVVSAREELEKLGEAADVERIERFTDRIDQLTAALDRAREVGDLSRQLNASRAIVDEINSLADAAQLRINQFGKGAVEPVEDFQKTLDQIARTFGIEVKVEFERDVIAKDTRAVADQILDTITATLRQNQGSLLEELTPGLDPFIAPLGGREDALRTFLPEGRFEIQAIDDGSADRLFREIQSTLAPLQDELQAAFEVGDDNGVTRLLKTIRAQLSSTVTEFLKSTDLISFSSASALELLNDLAAKAEEEVVALQEKITKEGAKKPLPPREEGDEFGLEPDQLQRNRELLDGRVKAFQLEFEERQALLGLEGPEAAAALRRLQFERALADAHLDDAEALKRRQEFQQIDERLTSADRARLALQPDKGSSGGAKTDPQRENQLDTLLEARLEEARAVLTQSDALGNFVVKLQEERRALDLTIGKNQEETQQIRELLQLEKLVAEAKDLDAETREKVFEAGVKEIETLKALRTQQRDLNESRNETGEGLSARLEEAEAVLRTGENVDGLILSLRRERQEREKKLGLSASEIEAYDRLARVEETLASAAQLTGEQRETALAQAQREIEAIQNLRVEEERLAEVKAEDRERRTSVGRAIDSYRAENAQLADQIDLIDARSDKEREAIALRQGERTIARGTDTESSSLRELLGLLEREIVTRLRLQNLLEDRAQVRSQIEDRIRATRDENRGLQEQLELLRAQGVVGRAEVSTRFATTPRNDRDLTNLSQAELITLLEKELQLRESLQVSSQLAERTETSRLETRELERQLAFNQQQTRAVRTTNELLAQGVEPLSEQTRLSAELTRQETERRVVVQEIQDLFAETIKGGFDIRAEGLDGLIEKFKTLGDLVNQILRRSKIRLDIETDETSRRIEEVVNQIRQEKVELTKTNEEREVSARLRGLEGKATEEQIEAVRREVSELQDLKVDRQFSDELARGFTDGFRDILGRGVEFEEAMRGVLNRIIQAFLEARIFQPFENFLSNAFAPRTPAAPAAPAPKALGGVFNAGVEAFAFGASFDSPRLLPGANPRELDPFATQAFASGNPFLNSVVNVPTIAPLALFGEAGPEAIVPLRGSGAGLGVSAYLGGQELTSAPLKRGTDGRLGIDLDALLSNLDSLPPERRALPDSRDEMRRFERGDVLFNRVEPFELGGTFGERRSIATRVEAFELGAIHDVHRSVWTDVRAFEEGGVFAGGFASRRDDESEAPQPIVLLTPELGSGNASAASAQPVVYQQTVHYHFGSGVSADAGFRRSARQNEQNLRDQHRRVFGGK